MKKVALFVWIALGGVALVISGCDKSTDPSDAFGPEDQASIQSQIESDPLFNDRMTLDDQDAQTLGKTATPILPRAWGRRITSFERLFTYEHVNDELVIVTVKNTISGEIKIAAKYTPQDTALTIITKPFTEETTRKIKFVPRVATNSTAGRWRPSEVSAVKGGSVNPQAILTFTQMEVYAGSDTLIITDPNEYYLKLPTFVGRQMPSFGTSTPVTVRLTLTSTESDTDMVFLHRPFMWLNASAFKPAHARMTLVSQTGSGPYTRTYELSWSSHLQGRHHFFVSGITRNSLFDDAAAWATQLWGVPYIAQ